MERVTTMDQENTSSLLRELDSVSDCPDAYQRFQKAHQTKLPDTLKQYLDEYLAVHQELRIPQIIFDSNLNKNYVNQFFNGYARHPDKYKLIPVCIAMHMTVRETDRALFLAGQPKLYVKNNLDAALIICINRGYGTMTRVNQFLRENGLQEL